VIGTRGLTGLEHLVLGSTAETVVRLARCPVLTVHPNDASIGDSIDTVVVPTDLGPEAVEAADAFARLFPDAEGVRVVLAFADPTPPYLEPFRHDALERWGEADGRGEDIEERMQPVTARLEAKGFSVEKEVLDGGPVQAVTDLARERGAALIVLATHRRSALTNLLTGRTTQRIVQHAPCPVLAVPVSKKDAPASD
jgi:nucleotide-binding universal stress UspA family protein